MKELRQFLADTVDLQAQFLVQRLQQALPKMLAKTLLCRAGRTWSSNSSASPAPRRDATLWSIMLTSKVKACSTASVITGKDGACCKCSKV